MSHAAPVIETEDEYTAIERAVLETPRGRWFLQEFGQRNRAADTGEVIGAIERLYDLARETRADARFGFLYHEMQEMRRALGAACETMAAIKPGSRRNDHDTGTEELAAIAEAANRAAGDIAHAAGRLQEISEALRGSGADTDLCDEIEMHASGIFMASAYQEMTGKRIGAIIDALGQMEAHITRSIALWEEEAGRS
ncbi:conserved hypothetical protein [Parvibaculum lavamentivorans DS-1]|uniref:Uncharacterized protein n=1 Tax=Parvibaculum lavamentivorans (strain DS-1 / DSM 13023 / NCIMB 13966) TaxID=402881 RepID=A7HW15_PARL1|nr:hypothetical protein [Parvibaculum lavamentivorans]ABS64098.1 conserved hypothetical protein [Parvibaculum lavamentivorans DS-1]